MSLKGHLHARSESLEEKVSKTIYCPSHIAVASNRASPYVLNSVTRWLEKITQFLEKVAKTFEELSNAKISTSELYLKAQSINMKPLLEVEIPTINHTMKMLFIGKNI